MNKMERILEKDKVKSFFEKSRRKIVHLDVTDEEVILALEFPIDEKGNITRKDVCGVITDYRNHEIPFIEGIHPFLHIKALSLYQPTCNGIHLVYLDRNPKENRIMKKGDYYCGPSFIIVPTIKVEETEDSFFIYAVGQQYDNQEGVLTSVPTPNRFTFNKVDLGLE